MKIKLGIQTPKNGWRELLVEKVVENFPMISYNALKAIPKTRCHPKPPLIFRDAKLTPINTMMKILKAEDVLLYFSSS